MEILTIIKGFIIGGSMLIPGVSGGTMAMILKLYRRLITSISSFMKHKKESVLFLLQFCIGAGAAWLILSRPMVALNGAFPKQMACFVVGAIVGGIPVIYRETKETKFSIWSLVFLAICLVLVFGLAALPRNGFENSGAGLGGVMIQFLAGILGALALILPGISFSSMLYMMGVYDFIWGAVGNRDVVALLPFGLGMIIGILFLTKFLDVAMTRFPHATYMIILGFVIGSIWDILKEMPAAPAGVEIPVCIALMAAGFLIIYLLSRTEDKYEKNSQ